MWADILQKFSDSPSQALVVRFLLENGFGVNKSGRVMCNGIELPATHVSKAIGTDRRVIDATTRHILAMPEICDIFLNLRVTPDLSRVAESLNLAVITVFPKDAGEKGIVGSAVKVLSDHDLSIRQIFVTDPLLSEDPKLVIIIDGEIPPVVYEELRSLPQVRQLII